MSAAEARVAVRVSRASAIIVQRVAPEAADWFLEWQERVAAAAAKVVPGYRGTDVYPPSAERGDEWVVALHFDGQQSMQAWLDSPVRAERIAELRRRVGDFTLERMPSGFNAWFTKAAAAERRAPTPSWKMALTVLFALYPTVMILAIFPGRALSPYGMAIPMLVGNACSVCLLQWVVMPLVTRLLAPWLEAREDARARHVVGALAVVAAIGVFAALFRQFTG